MKSTSKFALHSLLVILTLGFFSGCVALVPHSPNTRLVEELGADAAESKFAEILNRSTQPRYQGTEVSEDSFKTSQTGVVMGAWYQTHHVTNQIQIYFNNISRVEVYENNAVFVRGVGDVVLLRAAFTNLEDATMLADLIESFKASK